MKTDESLMNRILGVFIQFLPDILFIVYVITLYFLMGFSHERFVTFIIIGFMLLIMMRLIMITYGASFFYYNRINKIKEIIYEFKKGRFTSQLDDIKGNDGFAKVLKELIQVGKHLDSVVSSQRNEINKFHELYNSMVFSISSFFIVMNEKDEIVYANEGFCKKLHFDQDEINDKKIEDIFYFVNARLKGGISQARSQGKSVVLEKTHLLSVNKVSIIADIKISNVVMQSQNQIIIIFDDVTNKLRKDYQISLMSQISESIQRDTEISRVLQTILTGVTSGSGLGFNRAQLFLYEENKNRLAGKMAVGPDSFEEAIDVWSNVSGIQISEDKNSLLEINSGREFMDNILKTDYSLNDTNVFVASFISREIIHITDSWNDERVNETILKFMDVKEFVVMPIIAVNKAIGIMIVDNKFNQVPIGNDSIELLSIFTSQAALSIESYNNLSTVQKEMDKIANKQDAIVESEKMAAVGRIAAHIAHEIRNPLVTMGGYARRIVQRTKENSKLATVNKAADIILKESERLEKILSNVMDFTRPSRYIKEFNNINDIIDDTVNLLKNVFNEKKVTLNLSLKEDLVLVKSDSNQMKQVILNLLQNSIDVMPSGGDIEISTFNDDESVVIKVRDSGSGIDEEDPNIIFEPFFTKKVTGVGLGLANVKKIIKDHQGKISVVNREDEGVEFTIEIPVPS